MSNISMRAQPWSAHLGRQRRASPRVGGRHGFYAALRHPRTDPQEPVVAPCPLRECACDRGGVRLPMSFWLTGLTTHDDLAPDASDPRAQLAVACTAASFVASVAAAAPACTSSRRRAGTRPERRGQLGNGAGAAGCLTITSPSPGFTLDKRVRLDASTPASRARWRP